MGGSKKNENADHFQTKLLARAEDCLFSVKALQRAAEVYKHELWQVITAEERWDVAVNAFYAHDDESQLWPAESGQMPTTIGLSGFSDNASSVLKAAVENFQKISRLTWLLDDDGMDDDTVFSLVVGKNNLTQENNPFKQTMPAENEIKLMAARRKSLNEESSPFLSRQAKKNLEDAEPILKSMIKPQRKLVAFHTALQILQADLKKNDAIINKGRRDVSSVIKFFRRVNEIFKKVKKAFGKGAKKQVLTKGLTDIEEKAMDPYEKHPKPGFR